MRADYLRGPARRKGDKVERGRGLAAVGPPARSRQEHKENTRTCVSTAVCSPGNLRLHLNMHMSIENEHATARWAVATFYCCKNTCGTLTWHYTVVKAEACDRSVFMLRCTYVWRPFVSSRLGVETSGAGMWRAAALAARWSRAS